MKETTLKQEANRACFIPVSCFAYSSTMMMKATSSSETSVDFEWNTRRYISEELFITIAVRTSNPSVGITGPPCSWGYKYGNLALHVGGVSNLRQ
jgi:hypothetical protein